MMTQNNTLDIRCLVKLKLVQQELRVMFMKSLIRAKGKTKLSLRDDLLAMIIYGNSDYSE